MEKTPDKNPNYWFDDYQQKGDEYNIPDGIKFHLQLGMHLLTAQLMLA